MLKAALTKTQFDALDEAGKGLYGEVEGVDGLYVLQVESVAAGTRTFALEDVAGLKKAVSELRTKAQERADALAAFGGIDPAEAKSAMAKATQYSDIENMKDDKLKAQAKAIEEQLEAKYQKEIEKLRSDSKKAASDLEQAISRHGQSYLKSEALRVFATHKVMADWQDVMLEKVRAVTKVKPNGDGGFKIEVLHPDGTPKITTRQNSTELMSLDELVGTDFKNSQALAVCFEGTNASGSGAGSPNRQATGRQFVLSQADARSASKYRAAKDAAEKAGQTLVIQ